ncbi:MAG TPA: 4-hydroxy-tetrahydrodipicolinate reductase [Burkholderiales bacterium]|nr:4-hydroxy-tetrahydrodipicolinate reductase [Burkholderiales bacterium]
MLNIGLIGADGKMGQEIIKIISANKTFYNLSYAIISTQKSINSKLDDSIVLNNISAVGKVDVIVDFSNPNSIFNTLNYCLDSNTPIVIGTTGFNAEQKQLINSTSKKIPVLLSPNMSLSVNVLFNLVNIAATKLINFEAEIFEAHHRNKKDSPSGTAIKLGEIIAKARGVDFLSTAKFTRHSSNEIRNKNEIGFSVSRGGNIIGKHQVSFISDNEILKLTSEISNRSSFAYGALIAAKFLVNQKAGMYDMSDVLKL